MEAVEVFQCKRPVLTQSPLVANGCVDKEDRLLYQGSQQLEALLVRCMRGLSQCSADDYRSYVKAHPAPPTGTACSGTDSPLLALQAVSRAIGDVFNLDWGPGHKFSAELCPRKRKFLMETCGPKVPKLFGDCTELGETAYDHISKQHVPVDDVEWLFMGFPCKDVSSLCEKRAEHRDAFAEDMTKSPQTGVVFKDGVLRYVKEHGSQLQAVLLENVLGLAVGSPSPLDTCVAELHAAGMQTFVYNLSPLDLGFPIARPRLWLLCVPRALINGMALHAAQAIMQTTIDLCASEGPSHLTFEHTLLDDGHHVLQAELDACKKAPCVEWADVPKKRLQRNTSWPEQHLEHCMHSASSSSKWAENPVPGSMEQTLFPTLRMIGPREFDMLRIKFGMTYPQRPRRVVNISQSFKRSTENPGTLTPGMRHYISDKCRLVNGLEAFLQQGLYYGSEMMDTIAANFTSQFLLDLSGNAFHVWVVAIFFFAGQNLLAKCARCRQPCPYDGVLPPLEEAAEALGTSLDLDALWAAAPAAPYGGLQLGDMWCSTGSPT